MFLRRREALSVSIRDYDTHAKNARQRAREAVGFVTMVKSGPCAKNAEAVPYVSIKDNDKSHKSYNVNSAIFFSELSIWWW